MVTRRCSFSAQSIRLNKTEAAAGEAVYEVVPFLRGGATDLNFTFALASVTMIMVPGLLASGRTGQVHFEKFFQPPGAGVGDVLKAGGFWAVGLPGAEIFGNREGALFCLPVCSAISLREPCCFRSLAS